MPDHDRAIAVRGLWVMRGQRTVLRDVDLDVYAGRITAIIGPNGAGKTTLLKAVLGLIPAKSGTICFGEHALSTLERSARARHIAYVPQQSLLRAALPAIDLVGQGRFAHGMGHADVRKRMALSALEQVGAADLAQRPFPHLSGGQQRLVLLARALCTQAPVLALDEPTSSLDIGHRLEICHLLRRLADSGKAVICVLHDLDDARRFADDVLILQEGRQVTSGAVTQALTAATVRQVYAVDMVENRALAFYLPTETP